MHEVGREEGQRRGRHPARRAVVHPRGPRRELVAGARCLQERGDGPDGDTLKYPDNVDK